MALSAFDDRSSPPGDAEVAAVLGPAFARWVDLKKRLGSVPGMHEEWGFASKSTGWGLRLKKGARVILYMIPCQGLFLAAVVLGDKAVRAARDSDLPAATLDLINGARRYAEGTGVRFEVREDADVDVARKLAAIKLAN